LEQKRKPMQERSKVLFESILEATGRLLPKFGEALSTNKIAKKAGVSIGSLYQYFPNKDAIFGSLAEQLIGKNADTLFKSLEDSESDEDINSAISSIVNNTVDMFMVNEDKMKKLFMIVPRLPAFNVILAFRERFFDAVSVRFSKNYPDVPKQDMDRIAFVAVSAIIGVLQQHIVMKEKRLTPDEIKKTCCDMCIGLVKESLADFGVEY